MNGVSFAKTALRKKMKHKFSPKIRRMLEMFPLTKDHGGQNTKLIRNQGQENAAECSEHFQDAGYRKHKEPLVTQTAKIVTSESFVVFFAQNQQLEKREIARRGVLTQLGLA